MTITTNDLCVTLRDIDIVKHASIKVEDNSMTTIIGPNGAGKSTLLKAIAGDIEITSGGLTINQQPINYQRKETNAINARHLAILPQLSLLNFPYTVEEVVELGRIPHETGQKVDKQIVTDCLTVVEMQAFSSRFYTQLSGGEKQRVQIARVLAQIWRKEDSSMQRTLILDEPNSSLDLGHQQSLMRFLQQFASTQVSVLMVLHDLNIAAQYSDQIIAMKDGQILYQGKPQDILTKNNINHLFDVESHVMLHPITGKPVILGL